jgi:uncharacterized membrane protein
MCAFYVFSFVAIKQQIYMNTPSIYLRTKFSRQNIKLCFFLFGFIYSFQAISQIKVTNNSTKPLWISIAYLSYSDSFKGFISEGWWKIIPGETKSVGNFEITSGNNTFYYYAYYNNGNSKYEWKGSYSFATHPLDAFKIINADKAYVLKENPKYQSIGFRKKQFYLRMIDAKTYTLSLTD